jgi:hypothetical protein
MSFMSSGRVVYTIGLRLFSGGVHVAETEKGKLVTSTDKVARSTGGQRSSVSNCRRGAKSADPMRAKPFWPSTAPKGAGLAAEKGP